MAIHHDERPTERVERVERVEQLHDRPVYPTAPASTNVNASASTGMGPVWTVTSVVTLIFTVLELLLLLRFIFKLTGANANQPLIRTLYNATDPLARPFQGIFPESTGFPVIDIPALLAIVFLFMIGALIVALVRAIMTPRSL